MVLAAIDLHMVIIKVHVGQILVDDVLLDRGSRTNIITEDLKKWLGVTFPQACSLYASNGGSKFDKPIRIIWDLKIHIHGIPNIATFTIMWKNVLDGNYSMLFGQPWFRDAKVIHNWGKNMITIEANGTIIVTKHLDVNTKQPKVILYYDFANGITNELEILLQSELELFTIGMITLSELGTLMSDVILKIGSEELKFDFPRTLRDIPVDEVLAHLKVQKLKIAKWTLWKDVHICDLNLGTTTEPQLVKFNIDLDLSIVATMESLLKEYKDVFTWSYKDLKGIPPHISQHWIELDTMILPSHQNRYWMNPNYTVVVKQDLNKLLTTCFIVSMEEATWLSPIMVVPQKNGQLHICIDFWKVNATTKKDPYTLPFKEEVLDMVTKHEVYHFWIDFPVTIKSW